MLALYVVQGFPFCFTFQALEPVVHGRGRKVDSLDETYMGVHENLLYARKTKPLEGELFNMMVH